MKRTLAKAISLVCSPLVWVIVFLLSAYYKGLFQYNDMTLAVFAGAILFPLVIFFALYAAKKISDFDITKRQERYGILVVVNASAALLLYFLYSQHLAQLFYFTKTIVVVTAISTLITFFYKISFHMTFAFTFAILLNALFGFRLWLLYLTIPAVFWSRWHLKKHTAMQMLLALLVDSAIIALLWKN